MGQFFGKDFYGPPFELFGGYHLVALGIIALINLSFVFTKGRWTETAKTRFRIVLAIILIVDELAWHAWNYSIGAWTIQTMLPLHLCSALVFLSAYMLATRNYQIYEFAYFLGIGGALQALLTPDAGVYGFPHFRAIQVMVSHGAIVTAAIYMTLIEGFRPIWKSLLKVIIGMNIYMVLVGLLNWAIGSNYLFIAHKPETASLMDVLGPWPWYILAIEGIGLVMFLLLYLPFAIKDWRKKKSSILTPG